MAADRPRRPIVDRRTALRLAAVGAAVVAIVLGLLTLTGGDDDPQEPTLKGPPGAEFTMVRPEGWERVSDEERARLPGDPLAVLRRAEGQGLLVVNAPADTERDLDAVSKRLDRRLEKEIPDFRRVGARVVAVEAGPALLYSYARTRRATAHTVLVVPTDEQTYTLNAVVPAGADDAAREVGRMLFSFDA